MLNIEKVNLALTVDDGSWNNINRKKILDIKRQWSGIEIFSLNALFYNKTANIFTNPAAFLAQFKRVIEYAYILGAKYLIYGSTSSKYLMYKKVDKQESFVAAEASFISTMFDIAEYSCTHGIKIIIKPNKDSNFLNDDHYVRRIVDAINHPFIIAGTARCHLCTTHEDFNLMEAQTNSLSVRYKFFLEQRGGV
jgi:sugar phosphate isomerase/epimerase